MNIQKFFRFIFLALIFIFIFALFSVEIRDSDFWWHLKTGEYIYKTGSIPTTDPFAFTSLAKDPINPESKRIKFILTQYWLAQVVFYWVYNLFNFQGIIFLRAFILTLFIFIIYISLRREGAGLYLSVGLLIPTVMIISSNFTGERPQLFSFLFAFLLIFLMDGFRKRSSVAYDETKITGSSGMKYLMPIPFLMLIWTNLHGGFFVGTVLILGYLFCELVKYRAKKFGTSLNANSIKYFSMISVLSVIVSLINPNGYNVVSILTELEKSRYRETIIEAMSPLKIGLSYADVSLFFLILVLSLAVLLINLKKLDLTDAAIFSGLAIMGLSAVRFIPFFVPLATLVIARYGLKTGGNIFHTERFSSLIPKGRIVFVVCLLAILIVGSVKYDFFVKSGVRQNKYPEGAVKFLKENRITGNMFNPYYWGGYLIWGLYPDYKVFIDGRGLIEDVYFQYLNVFQAKYQKIEDIPEWKAILKAYNINFILTFSVDKFTGQMVPLVPALYNSPEWHLIYMDKISLIFIKDRPENKHFIERLGIPKEWLWSEVVTEALLKVRESPKRANFFITIGDAFINKKSYQDARSAYIKALETDPDNAVVRDRIKYLESYGY